MNNAIATENAALIADAERCVKCALCLPHCPTYLLKGEEGESPRGRIELISALARRAIEPTTDTIGHLDGCLTCRACEAVCPALVPYGRLIDGARNELEAHSRPGLLARSIALLTAHPAALSAVAPLLRTAMANSLLPRSLAGFKPYLRSMRRLPALAEGPRDGRPLDYFLGCIARGLDTQALVDGAEVLAAAGYRIRIPAKQTCCGALALHGGQRRRARHLARQNMAAFRGSEPIVSSASACTVQLAEYDELLPDGREFASRVIDISEVIAKSIEKGRLQVPRTERMRVALHIPCTQRNVLRSQASLRSLRALTELEIIELPGGCCGAAGSYFLEHPAVADALRAPLLAAVREVRPHCVLTTNVGCRLHLAAGLGTGGPEVLHLATFLARRLRRSTDGRKIPA